MAWYNPADPKQRNWMLMGLAALVLIVPFSMYYVTPRTETNQATRDHIEALDIQNRQAGVILARGGGDLEERMALYERHVSRLEELIPAREEVPALLDDIQARARMVGVDVVSLDPEPTEPAGPYNRTGYAMTVVGEYHDVGRFLTEIASLSRIVNTVQLDLGLSALPQGSSEAEFPVQAGFRIETYVLPDQTALPAAQIPGGAP